MVSRSRLNVISHTTEPCDIPSTAQAVAVAGTGDGFFKTLRPANCTQVVNGGRRTNCVGPFPSDLQPICLENREGCETILSPVPPTPPNSKHKPEVDVGVSLPTPRKRELTRNFPEKQKQNRPERWEKPRGKVMRSSRVAE